jgi:hypothetical protein
MREGQFYTLSAILPQKQEKDTQKLRRSDIRTPEEFSHIVFKFEDNQTYKQSLLGFVFTPFRCFIRRNESPNFFMESGMHISLLTQK